MEIRLRDVVDDDLEVFLAFEHEPEAAAAARFAPRERERFLAHWRTRVLGGPDVVVQTVLADGGVAGNIVTWDESDGRRFVGYWLGREYWGRGVGTTALRAFLAHDRARPLYADPHVENTASCRLLERLGFVRQGMSDGEHVLYVAR